MTAHAYIIRADAPTRHPDAPPRIVGYWSDAIARAVAAVRDDGAVRAEIVELHTGRTLATHDATGWDMAPPEHPRPGAECGAVSRRILDDAPTVCRRPAGHPWFCTSDGRPSDAG